MADIPAREAVVMSAFPEPAQARELTREEQEARVAECAALDATVRASIRGGREAMWAMARAAYEFNEQMAWTALGFDTLTDYLGQPEIEMSYSTFRRLARVWREVVVLRGTDLPTLEGLDPSKVDIVLPAIKQGRGQLHDVLRDVEALGARELRDRYAATEAPAPEPEDDAAEPKHDVEPAASWIPDIPMPIEPETFPPRRQMTVAEALEIAGRDFAEMPRRDKLVAALRTLAAAVEGR